LPAREIYAILLISSTGKVKHVKGAKQILQWVLGLLISGLCLWLVFREISLQELRNALSQASYEGIIIGVLLIFAICGTRVIRWATLLTPQSYPFRRLLLALLAGQLSNSFLPARGGDLIRALLLKGNPQSSTAHILGTIAAEKVWDLGMLLLSALLLWALMPLPLWFVSSLEALAVALFLGWLFAMLLLLYRPRWLALLTRVLAPLPLPGKDKIVRFLDNLLKGLEPLRQPVKALWVTIWSALIWMLGAVVNLAILWAFGKPSLAASLFLLVALMAGISAPIPAAPGKLGIYEGIAVAVLSFFQVPQAQALAIGLVLHAVVLIPPVALVILLSLAEQRAIILVEKRQSGN